MNGSEFDWHAFEAYLLLKYSARDPCYPIDEIRHRIAGAPYYSGDT
jgi:hypothetical protein